MKIDFEKYADGLIPAIVQDARTQKVLMHGFMNRKALKKTEKRGKVSFYSRTERKVFTHGERKGNFLNVKEILLDCGKDAILIKAYPKGKICDKNSGTCFKEKNKAESFLYEFEKITEDRKSKPRKTSHTSKFFERGRNQIAKKLGEEAVELVIESMEADDELFKAEASDLLYYFMLMLVERNIKLDEVLQVLKKRRR